MCGAPNVDAGQTVAVARPGAVMPDGTKLKQAKLRGVVSEGMILAASELELEPAGERSPGIMVLDDLTPDAEFAAGTPLAEVLPISTDVLELEITPNRPDCLGVYGVARELHAATGAALAPRALGRGPGRGGEPHGARVRVECPDLCPRFTARVFEDVTIAPSPLWLKARLMAAGQRPINNVVDITNYAMLLTGQPLHAFDLDRVAGGELVVRRAREGEQVETLDGQTRTLDSEMVVIEDAEGPTSIAGVMGGARSEVEPDTTRVLLEVATWDGPNIHRTSWTLGLRSEASGRFEKGLQPEQCLHAQAVATRLMLELCGARLVPGTIDVGGDGPALQAIALRERRVEAILGVPVAVERQAEILHALDFATAPLDGALDVTVPALRRDDVTREIDLIEEVARIDGLERLPATLPARRGAAGRLTHAQRVRRGAEDAMVGRGLHEIVGWSFADPGLLDRLRLPAGHPLRDVVMVENPLSEEQSMMRPTLLGSLLDAARHNVSRGAARDRDLRVRQRLPGARGRRRGPRDDAGRRAPRARRAAERRPPAALLARRARRGRLLRRQGAARRAARQLPAGLGRAARRGRALAVPASRPQRRGRVRSDAGTVLLGFLGEVHPLVAEQWDLPRTAVFAVDLGKLAAAAPEVTTFAPFGAFPVLRQDIAVTLPGAVPAERAVAAVREAGGATLESAEVFDVYTGEQVGEGRRSLALALTFRSLETTLTDEDVAPVRARIVAALEDLGGELRG